MQFQFNTDNRIPGNEGSAEALEGFLRDRLEPRFSSRLTRVEVYLRDHDGTRHGDDSIEATIEARPANADPVSVSARARTSGEALRSAADKLIARLNTEFGKADRVRT